ncbi:MAG: hypothetical protein WD894_14705 [Pirellulales bacterium]
MNDRDLITGLDACRPASDDLRQPELRAVAESIASDAHVAEIRVRIERIDAATFRAMHNISLPVGLESRLIARLQEAASGDTVGLEATSPSAVSTPDRRNSSTSRRKWLAWSGGLATAVAAMVAAVMFFRPAPPLERHDLEWGRDWHLQIVASGDWQRIKPDELDEHALPSELRPTPQRYRDASSIVGRDAYAYDLKLPDGTRATLFVIRQATRAGLPTSAPPQPQSPTLGLNVAYWQRGDVIYVLVVERIEDYRRLVTTTPQVAA